MLSQRSSQVTRHALERVLAPIETASGLPNAVYNDAGFFDFDRDRVMATTWAAIGFAHEVPEPRFARPVNFMGLPLLMMRNAGGDFRVFHNVCSHRGMLLVPDEARLRAGIQCRYHSWTYDLNGRLKATPHMGGVGVNTVPGFCRDAHGLKVVRSEIWMGIVFVNLDGEAPPFSELIAPLTTRWDQFTGKLDSARASVVDGAVEIDVQCNWKLAVENYCEAYHLPWLHPSLNSYSPLDQHYNIEIGETMSGQGSNTYNLSEVAGTRLPQFDDWPANQLRQAEYVSLYPNVLLGIQADHFFAMILQPVAIKQTREKLMLYFLGDAADNDEHHGSRGSVAASWRQVFGEDVFAVEGLQLGRCSPGFDGGVFSPVLDSPSHHFHKWVATNYVAAMDSPPVS